MHSVGGLEMSTEKERCFLRKKASQGRGHVGWVLSISRSFKAKR